MAFKKGQSGNPAGRPKGIADRRGQYREILEGHMPELVNKVIELAKAGDTQALKMCIERGLPAKKVTDDPVDLGRPLEGSAAEQGRVILMAVSEGRITPDQASTLMSAIQAQARVIESDELERRLAALEGANDLKQSSLSGRPSKEKPPRR